jgi:tetratricopeptide (TPR) repeat protein
VALFGGKKNNSGGDGASATASASAAPLRDPRKARPWFERAKSMSDAQNYDYAIECYVSGLKFEPDSLTQHEALREVALKRKVRGGKPKGKPPVRGKSHVEKMLEAEFMFSVDPTNASAGLKVMEEAMAATNADDEDIDLSEVAYWVGELAVEANRTAKRQSKAIYLKVRDLYVGMGAFDKAAEACALAVQLDPNNGQLIREFTNLQAETTMMKGGYSGEKGDFRKGVKDADKQAALEQESQIAKTDDTKDQIIDRLRSEYNDSPDDIQRLEKLVRALNDKDEKASEDEGIKLLETAWEQGGQYRHKMWIGDIRMKQFKRALREAKAKAQASPDDVALMDQVKRIVAAQAKFELGEYRERVKNYPTDMSLRYQLGRRELQLHLYDDAIGSLQQAKSDPKNRGAASVFLGQAFAKKEWFDEAIATYRQAIEEHPGADDDSVVMELRYQLFDSLESKAKREDNLEMAQEAASIASKIAQININFKDIRVRVDQLRKTVDGLKAKA